MGRIRSWTSRVALVGATAMLLASCGQSQPAVCERADQLRASLHDVQNINLSENGLNSLEAALGQVRTNLEGLQSEPKNQFQPQINGVKASLDQLSTSLSAAKTDPTATSLSAVGTALRSLQTAARNLQETVASTC